MPDTPLNPDALEAAASVLCDETAGHHTRYADLKTGLAKKLWGQRAEHVVSAYLAVAQPEVNSVESIPATIQVISWEEEPEHECWKLSPDETFVGLIVKCDRAWSPADSYTLNIERPEANDA